jgi:hypothetical protein
LVVNYYSKDRTNSLSILLIELILSSDNNQYKEVNGLSIHQSLHSNSNRHQFCFSTSFGTLKLWSLKWKGTSWSLSYGSVQSVPITTKVVSLSPVHGEVYSIQHYVIKFVSDLRRVNGFFPVLRFPATEMLLKVAVNTINHLGVVKVIDHNLTP